MPTSDVKGAKTTDDVFIMKENEKYVKTSKTIEPSFFRDILPQYQSSFFMILTFVMFIYTGNPCITLCL